MIARDPGELEVVPRAVAIGTFDGVHRGHRAVLDAAAAAGLRTTAVTFDPHPRIVLGHEVELLSTLERRLELLSGAGAEDILVVPFSTETAALVPEAFVEAFLTRIGTRAVAAGADFRFGHRRAGDLDLLRSLAQALGGHCVTLRRTAVGPFSVDEADPERLLPVSETLARLPEGARARVPETIRRGVLDLEAA